MRFFFIVIIISVCHLAGCASEFGGDLGEGASARQDKHRRRIFHSQLKSVTLGMSRDQVVSAVGKAELIEKSSGNGSIPSGHEVLKYGVRSGSTFGTLGCIILNEEGQVSEVFGDEGDDGDLARVCEMFPNEDELQHLLNVIHSLPPEIDGGTYNPHNMIMVVNRLQPLGKKKILALLREYDRVTEGDVPEALYLVPDIVFPKCNSAKAKMKLDLGAPVPPGPDDADEIPLFPLLLVNDYPLILISGYEVSGEGEGIEGYLVFFEKNCEVRQKPLNPTGELDVVVEKIKKEHPWVFADTDPWAGKFREDMIRQQLFRALKSMKERKK